MIRHDHSRMKMNCSSMIVDAVLQNEPAGDRGEFQILIGAESYEERPIIALVVGKAAAIFVATEFCGEHANVLTGNLTDRCANIRVEDQQLCWLVPKRNEVVCAWLVCAGRSARDHTIKIRGLLPSTCGESHESPAQQLAFASRCNPHAPENWL